MSFTHLPAQRPAPGPLRASLALLLAGPFPLLAQTPGPAAAASPAASSVSPSVPQQLPVVTVSGHGAAAPSYLVSRPSSMGMKIQAAQRHTPFTVNQVSEDLIVERGDLNLYDTLERFAGITANGGRSDIGTNMARTLSIRGFSTSNGGQSLVNGFRTYSTGAEMRGTDSLESVELLRGPASLYYGAAQPGGVFNYNYKRPKAGAAYVLRSRIDTEGSIGGMADLAGPLRRDARLRYRLVGSHTHFEDDQRGVWSRPASLLAALQWLPSPTLDTTLSYEHLDVRAVPEKENNKRTKSGRYYPIAVRDSFLGQRNDRAERRVDTLIWDAAFRPSDAFKIAANLLYQRSEQWYQVTRPSGSGGGGTPPDPSPQGEIPRSVSFSPPSQQRNLSAGIDLSGQWVTGALRHEWLVGAGLGQSCSRSMSRRSLSGEFDSGLYPNRRTGAQVPRGRHAPAPLDPDTLDRGDWSFRDLVMAQSAYRAPWSQREDLNAYVQDLVLLPDGRTRLMAGLGWSRYDNLARGAHNFDTGRRNADTAHRTQDLMPRVAALYDLSDSATTYASYAESFSPQPSLTLLDTAGRPLLKPESGTQYELGYKKDLDSGDGLFNAALFWLEKRNVARAFNAATCDGTVTDPADPSFCTYVLDGLLRSRGLELGLSGQVLPGWQSSATYAYTDTEIVETADPFERGRSFANLPRHSASLWNKFLLPGAVARGRVWLGLGLQARSRMHSAYTSAGAWQAPGQGVFSLGLFWNRRLAGRDLSVQLNVQNLMNRQTYVGSSVPQGGTVVYGVLRRASLTTQLAF